MAYDEGVAQRICDVLVVPEEHTVALDLPHVREMDFTGVALKGFVYVAEQGFEEDLDLEMWVGKALSFVGTLPPK